MGLSNYQTAHINSSCSRMADCKSILIFYVSYGAGHWNAARAIAEAWIERRPLDRVSLVDVLNLTLLPYSYLSHALYGISTKYIPALYKYMYRLKDCNQCVKWLHSFYKSFSKHLLRVVEKNPADIIICTHPFPMAVFAEYKLKNNSRWLLSTVVTDYGAHKHWGHISVDIYFVASLRVKDELKLMGINSKQIVLSGIPVRTKANQNITEQVDCNKGSIIIGLLAHGLNPIYATKVFEKIMKCQSNFNVIANFGHSKYIRTRFERIAKNSKRHCEIIPFRTDFAFFLNRITILLTKPGGLTVSESLSYQVPLILLNGYPGQEEINASFVIENDVGLMPPLNRLSETIDVLISDENRIEMMKNNCRTIAKPNARDYIVDYLIEFSKCS